MAVIGKPISRCSRSSERRISNGSCRRTTSHGRSPTAGASESAYINYTPCSCTLSCSARGTAIVRYGWRRSTDNRGRCSDNVGVGVGALDHVQIRLLGGFALLSDGAAVDERWRLRKAKTLVKLLALAPGHHLHRDVVLDALWPHQDPAAATNNLHQALHAARRALGGQHVVLHDDT